MTAPDDPRPRNRSRLPRRRELRTRLRPELLEDRVTPATFVVNSLADGAPVADGQLTLREAVTAAVTNAPSGDAPAGSPAALDTITFAAAVAGGVINLNPAQGDLDLTGGGALSITGPRPGDPGGITVSGQGSVRVFNIVNAGTVSIADLTATAGSTLAAGGAILVQNSQVTLTSVAATASKAGTDGGGIAVLGIGSKLTLDASLVSGNRAGQDGGGIYIETGASAKISNTTVIGNILEADFDGAGIDNNGTTTITDSTIAGNFGSTVFSFGGGVENQGTLTISGTAIYGNAAARGGGISGSAGTLTVTNSTVAYNRAFASDGGGGIIVASGTATVVNSTVVGNADTSDAPDGAGGIAATSEAIVNLLNSIVSLNFAGPASANENVDPADLDTNVNNFLGGDPKLGPLEDNGGPTLTMLPFPGSPVIDSGANVNATDDGTAGGTPLATDQRGAGFPRIVGGTVDRGAAEFSPTAPTPAPAPPVTPTFVVNSLLDGAPAADGKLTLREAVTAATTNAPSGDAPAGTAGLDVITFDPSLFGGTINLNAAQGELVLDGGGDVEIVGLGGVAGGITISGQGAVRVFNIAATAGAVTLRDLTITRGNAGTGFGGGVQNLGPDTTLT
ncbi:MAG TPA: right-handed parallel beta-helix repeat-containing protein, partial [Gemmataceae bacterium]